MVLEHIFPDNWTEKRLRYSLIIGFVFSSLSILISGLLFGANSGLISVFLTSLLILPLLEHLFKGYNGLGTSYAIWHKPLS